MHDRVLTRHHRGGSFHAARRRRGSGRRGADGERPVQRRHDRRRQDPPPHRTGAGCAEAVKGPTAGRAPRFAEVVLPVPVSRTYTYEIPTALLERGRDLVGVRSESTRLNSSHITISYAVFCLKKKIKETQHIDIATPIRAVEYLHMVHVD